MVFFFRLIMTTKTKASKKNQCKKSKRKRSDSNNAKVGGQQPRRKKQTLENTALATVLSARDIERAIVLSSNFQREREFMYGIMDEIYRATPEDDDAKNTEEDEDIDIEIVTKKDDSENKYMRAQEMYLGLWETFHKTDNLYRRCDSFFHSGIWNLIDFYVNRTQMLLQRNCQVLVFILVNYRDNYYNESGECLMNERMRNLKFLRKFDIWCAGDRNKILFNLQNKNLLDDAMNKRVEMLKMLKAKWRKNEDINLSMRSNPKSKCECEERFNRVILE